MMNKKINFKAAVLAFASVALSQYALAQSPGAFAPPVTFAAPGASAAASGDFNSDGLIDVVTANGISTGSHGVSILLSNGDGSFQAPRNFAMGGDPTAIVTGDFNGDGKLDVAVANALTNTVSVAFGNGDGTLQPAASYLLPGAPSILLGADFNNDGRTDLVAVVLIPVGTGIYQDVVLMSNGDGTLSQSTLPGARGLVVGDFNADGKADLGVLGLATVGAIIKFGNGDGTFTDSPVPSGFPPLFVTSAAVGDFNGDGHLDIYVESINKERFSFANGLVVLGNGNGSFSVTASNFPLDGDNLTVGDFNGDGKLDVAAVYPGPISFNPIPAPPTIRIAYGSSTGTLSLPVSVPAGPSTATFTGAPLVIADFDRNGSPDFAWASGSTLNVVRNASGNPPLLWKLTFDVNSPLGGVTNVNGTVSIGSPAPAAGAVITLISSDPVSAFFPAGNTVTIPAGATSATFSIATAVVVAPELVTITAAWNGVSVASTFNLLSPFIITSMTLQPASFYGWLGGGGYTTATVNFSSPAPDGTVLTFTSANQALLAPAAASGTPAASVLSTNPLTITVPAGSTSASFFASGQTNVAADTPVQLTASMVTAGVPQGAPRTATATILAATDTVRVTKAELILKTGQLTIEGTTSGLTGAVRVSTTAGTAIPGFGLGFQFVTGGKFKVQTIITGPLLNIAVQSRFGGLTISPVAQK